MTGDRKKIDWMKPVYTMDGCRVSKVRREHNLFYAIYRQKSDDGWDDEVTRHCWVDAYGCDIDSPDKRLVTNDLPAEAK